MLRLGTTVTATFVVAGATCHSNLRLPVTRQFLPFKGSTLYNIQESLAGKKVMITNELSMMGRKMLV